MPSRSGEWLGLRRECIPIPDESPAAPEWRASHHPREREIVEFVCRGMKNKEIAEALSITPGTVKVHLMHIFEKTGVKDRFQLALQGRQFLERSRG